MQMTSKQKAVPQPINEIKAVLDRVSILEQKVSEANSKNEQLHLTIQKQTDLLQQLLNRNNSLQQANIKSNTHCQPEPSNQCLLQSSSTTVVSDDTTSSKNAVSYSNACVPPSYQSRMYNSSLFYDYKNLQESSLAEYDAFHVKKENILLRTCLAKFTNLH